MGTDDDMDCVDESGGGRREEVSLSNLNFFAISQFLDQVSNPVKKEEEGAGGNKPASMFQMMNHIQSLISMAVENAKQEEKSISHQKSKSVSSSYQTKHQQCNEWLKSEDA